MSVMERRPTAVMISSEEGKVWVPRLGEVQTITMRMAIPDISSFELARGSSEAIPIQIDSEISRRITNDVFVLDVGEKTQLMTEIYEQTWRDRHGYLVETPFLNVREMTVSLPVIDWIGFCRWFEAHAIDDFYSMIGHSWSHRQKAGSLAILTWIEREAIPSLMLGTDNKRVVIV